MVRWRRTPAIFAGLAGTAVWGVPALAGALTTDGAMNEVLLTLDDLLASPVAYFFIGLAAGAAVTGVAVGAGEHHAKKRLRRQLDEAMADNERLRSSMPAVIHISSPGIVLEPWPIGAGEAGPTVPARQGGPVTHAEPARDVLSTGGHQATPSVNGSAVGDGPSPHVTPSEELGSTAHLPLPRVEPAAPPTPVDDEVVAGLDEPDEPDPVIPASGPASRAQEVPDALVVPMPAPNAPAREALAAARSSRLRLRLDDLLPRIDDAPAAQAAKPAKPVDAADGGPTGQVVDRPVSGEPEPLMSEVGQPAQQPTPRPGRVPQPQTPVRQVVSAPPAPSPRPPHAASRDDYERVAEEYVRSNRDSERARSRSRGVRAILGERLRGNVMDGLPVIERADGSTADIGTSWWTREVGSTHSFAPLDPSATSSLPPVTAAPDPMSTAALRADELARAQRNARMAGLSSAQDDTSRLDGTTRAAVIAQRLSSVDMSFFPEEDDVQGEAEGDMFEQAMRALDAQDAAAITTTTSEEAAAGPTPISPDLQTGAVVAPDLAADAGRDKEASDYVDYLVRDEMERSRARRNQRTSHSILTVFEGTGDLSDAQRTRPGRHFAKPRGHDGGSRSREA